MATDSFQRASKVLNQRYGRWLFDSHYSICVTSACEMSLVLAAHDVQRRTRRELPANCDEHRLSRFHVLSLVNQDFSRSKHLRPASWIVAPLFAERAGREGTCVTPCGPRAERRHQP